MEKFLDILKFANQFKLAAGEDEELIPPTIPDPATQRVGEPPLPSELRPTAREFKVPVLAPNKPDMLVASLEAVERAQSKLDLIFSKMEKTEDVEILFYELYKHLERAQISYELATRT